MDSHEPVFARIEQIRIRIGISIAELSRRIGIDKKRLWYVLNGQREMRVEEFLKLCVALHIDPRSFVTKEMVDEVAAAIKASIERK